MKYLEFIKNEKVRNIIKYIILFFEISILVLIFIYLVFNNFIVANVVDTMLNNMEVL